MYPIDMPKYDFRGKTVTVTGAGSGIGCAAAMEFAYYGANVVAADINEEAAKKTARIIAENGGKCTPVNVDVSNSGNVEDLVRQTVNIYGALDVFISNAGIGGKVLPLIDQDESEFMKVIGVNLKGAFMCGKTAAEQMIKQGSGGKIIFTASIAAIEGGGFHGPYGASKGGLVTLVRTMASEWAQYGINVNAISPGLTDTGINREISNNPELLSEFLSKIPLRRMAKSEEIASLMLYLASPSANFITGTTIIADGGATIGG